MNLPMFEFDNQVVMVTGAAGAVGSVVARILDKTGSNTILLDIAQDRLENVTESLSDKAIGYAVDLTKEDHVEQMVSNVIDTHQKIDGLVNIAGGFAMNENTHQLNLGILDKMMDINVRSMITLTKYVLQDMYQKKSGAVINFGARAGIEGKANMGPYTGAKSMVMRLTESMAKEYLHSGIRINCILPGTINTKRNRQEMPEADHSSWVEPEEIAKVVLFLLSSEFSSAITGALIPVYGKTL